MKQFVIGIVLASAAHIAFSAEIYIVSSVNGRTDYYGLQGTVKQEGKDSWSSVISAVDTKTTSRVRFKAVYTGCGGEGGTLILEGESKPRYWTKPGNTNNGTVFDKIGEVICSVGMALTEKEIIR